MKINDLLASISGTSKPPAAAPAKRKPDDDLRPNSKAPRRTPPPTRPSQAPIRPSSTQTTSNVRSANGGFNRPSDGAKPYTGTGKPVSITSRPGPKPMNGGARPSATTIPAKEAAPVPVVTSNKPPKKGSYAEIMARAAQAQTTMSRVGTIQHKKVEKVPPPKRGERAVGRPDPRAQGAGRPGNASNSKSFQRDGTPGSTGEARNGNGVATKGKQLKPTKLTAAEKAKLAAEQRREERAKKHAAATTGYTGTSRPNIKPPAKKDDAPRGGALLNRAPSRPSASRRSRYDDYYDDEMDDFIDDEEGEEEELMPGYGKHYSYYDDESDGSSDMEAGLDDIDGEERRAERIARQEDIEEERLEKTLKQQKEDRKRQALEAIRARRG